jgi:hypothetical protein
MSPAHESFGQLRAHVVNNAPDLADTPITIAVVRRSTGIYEKVVVMGIDSWNSTQPHATKAAISSKDRSSDNGKCISPSRPSTAFG